MTENCTLLDWDSEHWGFPIARLNVSRLEATVLANTLQWCSANGVRCLYFLADGSCSKTLRLAHEGGFMFVEARIELRCNVGFGERSQSIPQQQIRMARKEDLEVLIHIARSEQKATRFFKDANFSASLASDLYAKWIQRDFREKKVLLAESPEGIPCGYVTVGLQSSGAAQIGIVAVQSAHRGQGYGRALIREALRCAATEGADGMSVVTQADNVAALRVYEDSGFRISGTGIWYHRWFR